MATVTPPSIDALPAAPDPANRSTFNTLAYPWSNSLPTFRTQVSALGANVKANADDAAASAAASAALVGLAAAQAALADADRVQTGLDRVQTGLDRAATAADVVSAAALLDQFDDRYLGVKAADPTLDNDGNALVAGAIYVNSVSGFLRAYTGSGWVQGISSIAGVSSVNGAMGDVTVQPTLVSGTNLKTINSVSLLGSGNIVATHQEATPLEMVTGTETALRSVSPSLVNQAIIALSAGGLRSLSGGGSITNLTSLNMLQDAGVYTLPVMTTVGDGFSLGSVASAASKAATVLSSDGWAIPTGFAVDTSKVLMPLYRGNAKGVWPAVSGGVIVPPILGSLASPMTGLIEFFGSATLSATLAVVMFAQTVVLNVTIYAVVVDLSTGAMGVPVVIVGPQLASKLTIYGKTTLSIYAVTSTSFIAGYPTLGAGSELSQYVVAGSISGTTITLGTPVSPSLSDAASSLVQLSSTLYAICVQGGILYCFSVSGTTVTVGAVANVSPAANGSVTEQILKISRISDTSFLAVYLTSGGGTSSTRGLSARVCTVSGTTITLQTSANYAGNDLRDAMRLLQPMVEGTSYAACVQNATNTSGSWFAMTISGNTVTLGAVNTQAVTLPSNHTVATALPTYNNLGPYRKLAQVVKYNNSTLLFARSSTSLIAISLSGTTLTFGTSPTISGLTGLLIDTTTLSGVYEIGADYGLVTVSGTTITLGTPIAAVPNWIISNTLSDKVGQYGGTWYAQGLLVASLPITATKWLFDTGTNTVFAGPIY